MKYLKDHSLQRTFFYLSFVTILCILGTSTMIDAQQRQGIGESAYSESAGHNEPELSILADDDSRTLSMTEMVYLPIITKPDVLSETEQAVLDIVNNERANAGCNPLTANTILTSAAREYSQDMATTGVNDHIGSDGSTPSDRVTRLGYSYSWVGENIAWGYSSPASVMNDWMNSDGHRANILNCNFTEIGIGHIVDNSTFYRNFWTQVFARPR